ncbi:MAG: MFS transporter [Anaerolineae bacterium]|nr:MFS transporter [Anaerolineae bacterium]
MNLTIWKRVLGAPYGVALGLCILLQGLLMAVFLPLLPIVLSEKIGLDKSGVMLFFLVNTFISIIVMLGTGYLSDGTVARYKLVLLGGLSATLGYLGIALATQPLHAYLGGIAAVGLSVIFPQLFAVAKAGVVAGWEREAQVIGITALRTLFSLGFVFGTAVSGWLARTMDIQAAFYLIAGATLILTLNAVLVLYRMEGYIAQEAARLIQTTDVGILPKRAVILPVYALVVPLLALTVIRGADSTRGIYLPLVMFQLFRDTSIAPLMFGITAAAELITMGLVGYLASRIGEKAAIAIGAVFGAVYFVILSFSQVLPLLYFAHLLYAVFLASLLGVAMAYVQSLLAHRSGMGGSLYMAVMNVGTLIGILSPVFVTGYEQTIFIIPAVLCLAGAALLMFGDRTVQIEQRIRAKQTQQETLLPGIAASGEIAG